MSVNDEVPPRADGAARTRPPSGLGIPAGQVWGPSGLQGRTYARTIEKVRDLLRRRSKKASNETIEELVQRTVVILTNKAQRTPEKFAGPKTFGSIALGVFHKQLLKLREREKARREREENWGTRMQAPPRRAMEPDAGLEQAAADSVERRIFERLSPMQARVMYELSDNKLSYREAAEVLGISIFTVRNHVVRAFEICREEARAGDMEPPEKKGSRRSSGESTPARETGAAGSGGDGGDHERASGVENAS